MADHYLQQVSTAIKTLLTELATTGSRVNDDDDTIRETADLPCIDVAVGAASRRRIGTIGIGGGLQALEVENDITVILKITVQANATLRPVLRQIANEIESRWLATPASRQLGGIARDCELVNIGEPFADMQADTRVGQMTMQFQVKVRSFEGKPDLS
jgi:hypothetical protein